MRLPAAMLAPIAASLILAAPASAGDQAWTTVNAFLTPADFSAGCAGFSWIDEGTCESLAGGPVAGEAFIWIVVSGSDGFATGDPTTPNGLSAVSFGIEHDLEIISWTGCTGGLEIPTPGWPGSSTGMAATWANACYEPAGNNARVGYFRVADASSGHLAVASTTLNVEIVDCDDLTYAICPEHTGSVDLAAGSDPVCAFAGGTEAPADLEASYQSCSVDLSWTHSGDGVDAFEIHRDGEPVTTVPATARSYSDSPIPATGETHAYEIVATTSCSRLASPPVEVVAEGALAPPFDVEATAEVCEITLTWDYAGAGVDNFQITRDGVVIATISAGARSYVDAGIPLSAPTYTYEVAAVNACDRAAAPPVVIQGLLLEAASACEASTDLCQLVHVTWTDNSMGESGFEVLRDGYVIATVPANVTAFDDEEVTAGEHAYAIVVTAPCGDGPASNVATGEASFLPPASDCAATSDLCDRVDVTWIDNSESEVGFDVRRAGELLATVGPDVTLFSDTTAEPGEPYVYEVIVVDTCGPAGPSAEAIGRRDETPVAATGLTASEGLCQRVHLEWADAADNESEQRVFRDGELIATLPPDTGSYDDEEATPGVTHDYVVELANACGAAATEAVSGIATDGAPAPPADLVATDVYCYAVTLEWIDAALDEEGFRIRRDGSELATVGAGVTTYEDLTATPGVSHAYTVTAFNACGESVLSNEANGTMLPDAEAVPAVSLVEPAPGAACIGNPVTLVWVPEPAAVLYEVAIRSDCAFPPVVETTTAESSLEIDLPLGDLHWQVRGQNGCGEWGEWSVCRAVSAAPELPAPSWAMGHWGYSLYYDFLWAPVATAEHYELAIFPNDCTFGPETQLFIVAGTDTAFHQSELGNVYTFLVTPIACDTRGESTDCEEIDYEVPVVLEYFRLHARPGEVLAEWATGSEQEIVGFHLYREEADGASRRVTEAPVPAGAGVYHHADVTVAPGRSYTYRLVEIDAGGVETTLAEAGARVPGATRVLALHARPNPFNPTVTLTVELPEAGRMRLEILDAAGRRVTRLAEGDHTAGTHRTTWEGTDDAGRPVASGIYFARVEASGRARVERLTLLK